MTQHSILEYSHSKDLKGKFLYVVESGDSYYECNKPLLGFTTIVVQTFGTGKMLIKAIPNKLAPLPPMLEKILDQLTKTAVILDQIKKDSNTDPALKEHLRSYPDIERIIVIADKNGAPATNFSVFKNGDYMLDIIPRD